MIDQAATVSTPEATPTCQNCGTPLLGPHCYRCGQPVHGLVRQFSSVVGDFLDSVLNIDSRIIHTLGPLFARPGYLSREYFAGRRVRYVSPVRLFVFLSIVTFFIAQFTLNFGDRTFQFSDEDRIAQATTATQVETLRQDALHDLAIARGKIPDVPGARAGIDAGIAKVNAKADKRIAELRDAAAHGEPPPDHKPNVQFGGGAPWNEKTNPLVIAWLPDFANHWINAQIAHAERNVERMQEDPSLFPHAVLGAIPSTLFVLLPVFALMLKLLYIFKRRLYMEHLIVALHSHAFLCLTLLLVFVTIGLRQWLAPQPGALHALLGWVEGLLFAWMPVYLLLMQKRVYGQGWTMTVIKYSILGFCYVLLLSFGAAFTALAALVWT